MAKQKETDPIRPNSTWKRVLLKAWDLACEHWFILGVACAIGFAAALPQLGRTGGWIRSEWSIKYGAVIVIFFLSGLSLKTRTLLTAAQRLPLHICIQIISLGITPLLGFATASAMRPTPMNSDLVSGLIICTSMPTTVSTNVVFTRQAGGNEAVALVNAVMGNILGIFVSPGLLYLYLGRASTAPYSDIIAQLGATVIAPLLAGQLVQAFLERATKWLADHINFGKVGNVCVLLLVWSTFCNTFYNKVTTDAGSLVVMALSCVALYMLFTVLCMLVYAVPVLVDMLKLDRPDTIAVAMCGATKTIALGMPLITVIYGGSPNVGILALPLLMYHAIQIICGSCLIPYMRTWSQQDAPDAAGTPDKEGTELAAGKCSKQGSCEEGGSKGSRGVAAGHAEEVASKMASHDSSTARIVLSLQDGEVASACHAGMQPEPGPGPSGLNMPLGGQQGLEGQGSRDEQQVRQVPGWGPRSHVSPAPAPSEITGAEQ
mmetsp:Transcript_6022/g.13138  ORF Transcript_6022/g.13138 Transcript_6022/m.13138 type:complete len:489 (+) Transcript_6022:68-1534(+)|eukprot:CAMPEP_0202921782 /NCGR_PEP_ID=MMETSP1392-20130828/77577_1 /ASSEMBLY_ACC=CAM_ASM_000868 /TAXON_ID=225041 /ORGANISM="Chlamydomonas chlamydogama, Strain SAG 11-48b" /LENGTH=488 /DNA_ID=CAMNT_0049615377 /DNA_START=49 /DNA_END=1515 /DNA_ORIENTATION=+